MEKTSTTELSWPKKMKGRPSKNLICTPTNAINYDSTLPTNKRSVHRNPSNFNSPPPLEFSDDEEDERKEKKVKLVDHLSQIEEKNKFNSRCKKKRNNDSKSDDPIVYTRRKNNAVVHRSEFYFSAQENEDVKETETHPNGSQLESGPTTPLPKKKLLVFILKKLQEKDTWGAFSKPLVKGEIPRYHDVIKKPMDYKTMRDKLDNRVYKNLEEFEADVYLICSNAMLFNGKNTVYYKQARDMQKIAKKEFANLKQEGDNNEPQPKIIRSGRHPVNKSQKKSLEISPVAPVVQEISSSDAITGYNLRKSPTWNGYLDRFLQPQRTRNAENYSEGLAGWNDDFPAHILMADMKHGKKHIMVDENRRDTYNQYQPPSSSNNSPILSGFVVDQKQLVSVGVLQDPLAYARSLSRFAKDLGPVAWKVASRKIEAAFPAGVPSGPWTSSNNTVVDCNSSNILSPSTLNPSSIAAAYGPYEGMLEAVRKFNNQNEIIVGDDASSWENQFPVQQRKYLF